MFNLTPELLQKGLTALGIAAGQVKQLDDETKRALAKFAMQAISSGDLNGYVRTRLGWIDERENAPVPAKNIRVTSRPLEAEFVEEPREKRRR